MRHLVQEYPVPGLAVVTIDTRQNQHPVLEIRLDKSYRGDLNDIAMTTPGPGDIYLRCNESSAINNSALLKFVEVLYQWDTSGDDVPDYAAVVAAIEDAMYLSSEAPHRFRRPQRGWFTKFVMFMMPPAPRWQIIFSFGELKPRFRWYHHVAAIPMLAMMLALIQLQVHYLHWTSYSVVTGFSAVLTHLGLSSNDKSAVYGVAITILISRMTKRRKSSTGPTTFSLLTLGFLNRAAVSEEQIFREGSEHWTLTQRVRSCIAFGVIHLSNLIYPLATIIPLAMGGGLFMAVYLRTYRRTRFRRAAVLNAAVWHRVYNRMAFIAMAVVIAASIGVWAYGALGALLLCEFFVGRYWSRSTRDRQVLPELNQVAVTE